MARKSVFGPRANIIKKPGSPAFSWDGFLGINPESEDGMTRSGAIADDGFVFEDFE